MSKELEGTFINNLDGYLIKVTNLEGALREARGGVHFNEEKIRRSKTDPEEIIFPQALKEWKHILLELEKLETKFKKIGIEKPLYSTPAMKARAMYKESGNKGFLKNNKLSPLYGLHSCAKSERLLREIDSLEIGESCENSSRVKITRAR